MSEWMNGKPDRAGMWLCGGRKPHPQFDVDCVVPVKEDDLQMAWDVGWWAYLGPLPEEPKMPPPKYRDVAADDVGKMVEVRDFSSVDWSERRLLVILPEPQSFRFLCEAVNDQTGHAPWRFARIVDDGTESQVWPDFWCNAYGTSVGHLRRKRQDVDEDTTQNRTAVLRLRVVEAIRV